MQKVKLKVKLKLMCGHALLLYCFTSTRISISSKSSLHTEFILFQKSTFIRLTFLSDLNPLSWVQGGKNNTDFNNERILASHILFSDR